MGFSSSHVWMWELGHKKCWALKNQCFRTVVLEKTLESPLGCKEIKPVNPKRNQSKYSLEGLMLKLKLYYFDPLISKSWLTGKDLDAGKDWRQGRSGWQRMRWFDSIIDSKDMSLSKLQEIVKDRETWCVSVHGVPKSQTRFGNWRKKRNAAKLDLFSKFQLFNFTF